MIKAARSPNPTVRIGNAESARLGTGISVGEIIKRAPVVVRPDVSIEAALNLMATRKVGSVVVIDEARGAPVGIITLQDVLLRVALPRADLAGPVASVMSRNLVCVTANVSAHQAALQMARNNLRHLPVIGADGGLLGMVSRNDLYDLLCASCLSIRKARKEAERED